MRYRRAQTRALQRLTEPWRVAVHLMGSSSGAWTHGQLPPLVMISTGRIGGGTSSGRHGNYDTEVTYVTRQTWRWTNWRGHERTAHTSRNLCRNKFGHRGRAYETTRPHPAQGASKIAAAAREPAWISSPPHEDPRPKGRTVECGGTPACSRESPPWQPQN